MPPVCSYLPGRGASRRRLLRARWRLGRARQRRATRHPGPRTLPRSRGRPDQTAQGRGLGSSLVQDALLQTASVADRIGVRALLIHAESEHAAAFYRRLSPAFMESPTDPLDVILLLKDLRWALREASNLQVST